MIYNHVKACYCNNSGDSLYDKKKTYSAKKCTDTISVLSFKIRSHKDGVSLLIAHKGIVSHTQDCIPVSTRQYNNEIDEGRLNKCIHHSLLDTLEFESHKRISLPDPFCFVNKKIHLERHGRDQNSRSTVDSLSYLLSTPLQVLSYNTCRERVRERKLFSLKRSQSPVWHKYKNKMAFKRSHFQVAIERYKSKNTITSKTRRYTEGKDVCNGFINTLMRQGKRLRYQTVLRQALLIA